MFIRVQADGDVFSEANEFLVNHNCGIRLIAEYLKMKTFLAPQFELDLCHHCGYLIGMPKIDPTTNGLNIFKNRTLYYMVRYQRTERNDISKIPIPCVGNNKALSLHVLDKIRRNPGVCHCLGEPSLVEFSLIGSDAAVIKKAKHSNLKKLFTNDFFTRKIFHDTDTEQKAAEKLTSIYWKSANVVPSKSSIQQSISFANFESRISILDGKSFTA